VSLNVSISHSRSLKVIRNDTFETGVLAYKSVSIETMSVSCTVSELLPLTKQEVNAFARVCLSVC